jgi:hypothetical protein
MPVIVPPDPLIRAKVEERRRADQAGVDAHLRSSRVVRGYHAQASDDSIGHVADFLFDEETWAIRYSLPIRVTGYPASMYSFLRNGFAL